MNTYIFIKFQQIVLKVSSSSESDVNYINLTFSPVNLDCINKLAQRCMLTFWDDNNTGLILLVSSRQQGTIGRRFLNVRSLRASPKRAFIIELHAQDVNSNPNEINYQSSPQAFFSDALHLMKILSSKLI